MINITLDSSWNLYVERTLKNCPIAMEYSINIFHKLSKIWREVNTDIGKPTKALLSGNEQCNLSATKLFYLYTGILAQVITESILKTVFTKGEFKEYERNVKRDTERIAQETAEKISKQGLIFEVELNKIECKECGFLNAPENDFCGKCQRKLDK